MSLPPLSPEQRIEPHGFRFRMALLFAALFWPMGIHLPYFPLWLEGRGFSASEIAIVLSSPMFFRIAATPIVTAIADRSSDRALVLIAVVAATLLISFGYFLDLGHFGVVLVSIALAVVWAPHASLADSLAVSGVRRFGADYSRMRIWGSISFLTANILGGTVLAYYGAATVPVLLSLGLASGLAVALCAPRLGRPRRPSHLSAADLPMAGRVLSDPYFLLLVVGAGLVNGSHGFANAFASIYWKSLGISSETVGILWALMVAAEILLYLVFRRLFGDATPSTLLTISAAAAILRWVAMPLVWPLGLGVGGFAAVQALHAFSTGLAILGLQKMIADRVSEQRTGAAQGAAFAATATAIAVVTLVSGPLYSRMGVDGFYPMAAIALAGGALTFAARRLEHGGPARR